jgi:hypothetical protein
VAAVAATAVEVMAEGVMAAAAVVVAVMVAIK